MKKHPIISLKLFLNPKDWSFVSYEFDPFGMIGIAVFCFVLTWQSWDEEDTGIGPL